MIIGMFLRNIKTYQRINYIPASNGLKLSGFIGPNGAGKSSILEAIDCILNDRTFNLNIYSRSKPEDCYIVPIFIIEKNILSDPLAKKITDTILEQMETFTGANAAENSPFQSFKSHLKEIESSIQLSNFYIVPLGKDGNSRISLGVFKTMLNLSDLDYASCLELLDKIRSIYTYIYIPRDINPEEFTKLETEEMQKLMGNMMGEVLENAIPNKVAEDISKKLKDHLEQLANDLEIYSYRSHLKVSPNIKRSDIVDLVIEEFFRIRKLHKKLDESWIEVGALSSGEKQTAILDIASKMIKQSAGKRKIILAIDEPESSLHISACFEQFQKLSQLSEFCVQLLFSTHWYGFIPTLEKGAINLISNESGTHKTTQLNISNYREEVGQLTRDSKGKFPADVLAKSIGDFIQSLLIGTTTVKPFSFLLCEGSSELIYFRKYLEREVSEINLRIIPVGGIKEIQRIYSYLEVAHKDFKNLIKGKIFLLCDTDVEIPSFDTSLDTDSIKCRRLLNSHTSKIATLVKTSSNQSSPKTDIEDALDGKTFIETLKKLSQDNEQLKELIPTSQIADGESSYYALNLSPTKYSELGEFFKKFEGKNKITFAQQYVELVKPDSSIPSWIKEIKKFFAG
jgi:predicted ATPase